MSSSDVENPISYSLLKRCTLCKNPTVPPFRQCKDCREKRRRYKKNSVMKKARLRLPDVMAIDLDDGILEQSVSASEPDNDVASDVPNTNSNGKRARPSENASSSKQKILKKPMKKPKPKPKPLMPKSLAELTGDQQRVALGMIKQDLNIAAQEHKISKVTKAKQTTQNPGTEYQTASALYGALGDFMRTNITSTQKRAFSFFGSHSIIPVPGVDLEKRLKIVEKDLRKIVRWSFSNDMFIAYKTTKTSATVTYPCTCLGTTPSAPSESTSKAPPTPVVSRWKVPPTPIGPHTVAPQKHFQAKLSQWAGFREKEASAVGGAVPKAAKSKATSASAIAARAMAAANGSSSSPAVVDSQDDTKAKLCSGKVTITVVDDTSHPVGIIGQRITVNIQHPSSANEGSLR